MDGRTPRPHAYPFVSFALHHTNNLNLCQVVTLNIDRGSNVVEIVHQTSTLDNSVIRGCQGRNDGVNWLVDDLTGRYSIAP